MEAEREEKIKAVLNNDKNVADLMKENKGAAHCLAEQIVDYGLKHGEERLGQMSSTQINIMKEVALKQSVVADSIVKDLVSPSMHKGDKIITKDIIRKDTAGVIEWAKDGLNKAITKEFAISRLEKLDIAKAQGIINNQAKSAIKQLEVMQQQFKRERISEIDNNKSIELNRNKGLEF